MRPPRRPPYQPDTETGRCHLRRRHQANARQPWSRQQNESHSMSLRAQRGPRPQPGRVIHRFRRLPQPGLRPEPNCLLTTNHTNATNSTRSACRFHSCDSCHSLFLCPYLVATKTKRRGGSGCGNVGTCPGTGRGRPLCLPSQGDHRGSPLQGRVGSSVSKITCARNQKRPGTSGRGRDREGEASNRDSFRRNLLMGRLPKGFGP